MTKVHFEQFFQFWKVFFLHISDDVSFFAVIMDETDFQIFHIWTGFHNFKGRLKIFLGPLINDILEIRIVDNAFSKTKPNVQVIVLTGMPENL